MPVTKVTPDTDALTLTINAEFDAPVARIWQIYADPRQLEKIWGPPTYPATFVDHSLTPGGRVSYYMTSPDGEKYCGVWQVTAVDEPRSFSFDDAFADEQFNVIESMPTSNNDYSFVEVDGRTHATYVNRYQTAEALQKVLDMGMIEGATGAINQIDDFIKA
ncbi:SRPBCC family protein [Jongsikchunia kroppenstedtii]|uniref:SRPBCC family protein n=1 Tax=Jongsikchunia kroppenstedtii TaxID=1121721 RepID=UPI000366E516|nr:SRPBCC domain-containing protein [Jongsikchunia kroppenstedtii]